MKAEHMRQITKLYEKMKVQRNKCLVLFKFEVGQIMEKCYKGDERSIMCACSEIASYIKTHYGEERSQQWWRGCWLTAARLTEDERKMLLRKNIKASEIDRIVKSSLPKIVGALKEVRKGNFDIPRAGKRRGMEREEAIKPPPLPYPFDEDEFENAMANYFSILTRGCTLPHHREQLINRVRKGFEEAMRKV